MKKQPESYIRKQVKDYLEWCKWFVFPIRQHLGCYPGLPDLIAIRDGRVLCIEIKTEKGKLSGCQEVFKINWEEHGGEYIVARGVEDLK
jgi:hypothetical protein